MQRKILVWVGVLLPLATILVAGAIYQSRAEHHDRTLMPGTLVDLGEYDLHLLCKGEAREGVPVVILETALWGSYPEWYPVMNPVSTITKVCSYDRMGMGWSSPSDKPTRSVDVARDLHNLLDLAGIDMEVLLVGWSAGGMYVRKFYELYPDKVAGLVFVDSAHEQQHQTVPNFGTDLTVIKFCDAISWTGIGRLFNLFESYAIESFRQTWIDEQLRVYNRTSFCSGLLNERLGFDSDLALNKPLVSLGDLPLTVIRAGKALRLEGLGEGYNQADVDQHTQGWVQLNEEMAALSSNSVLEVAENSGHAVPVEQPEIIVEAIKQMLK
ncbi:MAG: alpha/beta hydrolase [Halioglobus sp.]